jgi:hypothetical protein
MSERLTTIKYNLSENPDLDVGLLDQFYQELVLASRQINTFQSIIMKLFGG